MGETWKKLLVSSLICHAVVFGVLLVVSIFSFSTKTVLAEFQWSWITARTWAEYLRLAPVAQGWATLLVFGWIVPMGSVGTTGSSFDRFGGSIAVLLVLTTGFAVAFLVGYPAAASRVESLEFTTTLATRLRQEADEARDEQNYTRSLDLLNQYMVLVGESEAVEDLLIEVRDHARADEVRVASRTESERFQVPQSATAEELLSRASAAFQQEDYSTAHYMATLAQAVEPANEEAARLAAQALQRLEALAPDDLESEEARLFRRKQEAKAALTQRDYVEAYYSFAALAEEHPRDVDVRRYLETAEEQVTSLAVFRDEVESALALPGAPDVAFVNRSTGEAVELVAIGKLVRTASGVYGQNIELLETAPDGRPIRHIASDYGKLSDGHFIMDVIDRGSEALRVRATVYAGSPDAATEGLIEIAPSARELWLLALVSRNPSTANITALSQTITALDSYGLLSEPVQLEFMMRLATPFTFLVVSLFLMGFGWRYRSRYLHLPPFPTLVLIPAAPFFILPIYLVLQFAQRILLSTILLATSVIGSVVLLIVLQAFLLLLALSYVALGSRE